MCELDNKGQEWGYTNLFNAEDHSNSKEVVLWRKYSAVDNIYHVWSRYSCNGNGIGFTKNMIDSYLCTDGDPIAASPLYKGDNTLLDVVANRDPRLRQSIYVNDGEHYRFLGGGVAETFKFPTFNSGTSEKCVTGYQVFKGHNPDYTQYNSARGQTAQIYFRYGEALLINAEAKAELGTFKQADADKTINQLRLRVGMTDALLDVNNITTDPNWEFPELSPLLNEIRRERKVELAGEGFRVDDLLRWAAAGKLIKGYKPLGAKRAQWENIGTDEDPENLVGDITKVPVNANGYIDPYQGYSAVSNGYNFNTGRDYLYPLPTTELVLNTKLKQNPGWE